jgi:hypothetical protein
LNKADPLGGCPNIADRRRKIKTGRAEINKERSQINLEPLALKIKIFPKKVKVFFKRADKKLEDGPEAPTRPTRKRQPNELDDQP